MKIKKFTTNPFQENTYLLYDSSLEAIIIDPGMYYPHEFEEVKSFIKNENLVLKKIVNTHCHIDHVYGISQVMDYYKIPFYAHSLELENINNFESHSQLFGIKPRYDCPLPTHYLDKDETVKFGNSSLAILFTPGHSPGHLAFYSNIENLLIGGDVLFKGSIGRTDLPGGDFEVLKSSIINQLYTLPEATIIYSGHGENTTIKNEKSTNPFVRA